MIRKLLFFPPVILFIIAFFNLFAGGDDAFFNFALWSFGSFLCTFVCWPIAFDINDKQVPLPQVFFPIIAIAILFGIAFFNDFKKFGMEENAAFGSAILAGMAIIVAVMTLKGE